MNDFSEVLDLLGELSDYRLTNKLEYYSPYKYQIDFHHAKYKEGLAVQRALMAANQVGKTYCGAIEAAMHLTGKYPEWWGGHRFNHPIEMLIGSNTNETARDICQKELLGEPGDDKALGTGAVPKSDIIKTNRKPGVNNAFDSVIIKHVSGGHSKASFRAYEQGPKKFMGLRIDVGWCDEEPPAEIWAQFNRATLSTHGILYITFTPEEGVTEVVHGFVNDIKPGQALVRAAWEDAGHMTPEVIAEKMEHVAPHEREMRSKGIPLMGSGLVFPVVESEITIEPFKIPSHWPRLCGVDLGYDHPFASVWLAWDRDTDTIYVYDCYREKNALMAVQADAVNKRGKWIPIVWPHDGLIHDKKSGKPLRDIYAEEFGMNMKRECFSNPPSPGEKEGSGGAGVEVGIQELINRMETGRFKVFSNLTEWFEEFRMYHRQDGKIVKLYDDLMSATRYASQSLRFAMTEIVRAPVTKPRKGIRNWRK